MRKIRVLIVDDMAMVREILSAGLSMDPMIEVVGCAPDPYVASQKIIELKPDVLTLDVEKLMPQHPLPVVMVSSLTERGKKITFDALQSGAVDFIAKPSTDVARGLNGMLLELRTKVKIASIANVSHWKHKRSNEPVQASRPLEKHALDESTDKLVAIGASTGGTEAIREVITRFPHAGRIH